MFLAGSVEGAIDYARYGPDQRRRTPGDGVISVFALDPAARVQSFGSFAEAYEHYSVTSTKRLAFWATRRRQADVVQVRDEHIVVNPAVLTYLGFNLVGPKAGRVRGSRVGQELRKLSRRLIDGSTRAECEWDINTGMCEDWAEAARELLGAGDSYWFANLDSEMLEAEGIEGVHEMGGGELWHTIGHAVLSYEGRWYDSQHPDGVDVLSDLDLVREVERQDFLAARGGSLARTQATRQLRSHVSGGEGAIREQALYPLGRTRGEGTVGESSSVVFDPRNAVSLATIDYLTLSEQYAGAHGIRQQVRSKKALIWSPEGAAARRAAAAFIERAAPGDVVFINMVESFGEMPGIGSELVHRLEVAAQAEGATVALAVSANFDDRSPLPFWRRRGYEVISERPDVPAAEYALIGKILVPA
jgi:hypothetical protein